MFTQLGSAREPQQGPYPRSLSTIVLLLGGAYQQGSLAQFEVEVGNVAQGLSLIRGARRQLGSECPAIAAAWLSALEAVAHATAGDERAADRALLAGAADVEQIRTAPSLGAGSRNIARTAPRRARA
ncbi:hypothetical protein OH809_24605 [Streptomyces sp. NBC_00873]|uniref:hypothetical protein n=1 Tax=Streptomyces sp. NBC_00873 TaxID=2975852 RepID=UPI00386CE330|nr:hypothetical protein OH809_24605 [Streptomyces sp. NBC_00873]